MKKNIELLILLLVLNLTLAKPTIEPVENEDEINACIIICSECFINELNISNKQVNKYKIN
jgi:hypothetical protein